MSEQCFLSVALITFNEAENLPRTLNSVKNLADEILVLDSYSTDQTREIATDFGARVECRKFDGFSGQKNHLLSLCRGQWVLLLDADEELSPDLQTEIQNALKSPRASVFEFKFESYCFGKLVRYGGWSGFYKIRLFRKGVVSFSTERVHERFLVELGHQSMRLKHPLKHFTYTQIEECLEKMNRYSTSAARDLAEKNVSPSPFTWILSPLAAFIKGYFLKLGFLDGTRGFILATYNAHYHFSKYAKLRILSEEDSFKN